MKKAKIHDNRVGMKFYRYNAKKELDNARKTLAAFLSCDVKEIYFTSTGKPESASLI